MVMPDGRPLPRSAVALGRKLVKMPLASAGELRRAARLSRDQYKEGINYLIRAGLVHSAVFGALGRPVLRYWLSEEGLVLFEASEEESTWHRPGTIGNLINYDMPKVEAVHAVADRYVSEGRRISAVRFMERSPMCAVIELTYPGERYPAYVVVSWASAMDTESELFYRLEAIPEAMQGLGLHPADHFFPAALAVVGAREWTAARALTMASAVLGEWVYPSHITAWYHRDGGWHMSDGRSATVGNPPVETPRLLPPTPLLRPVASERQLGNDSLDQIIARVLWSGRAGPEMLELITLVGDYPVGAVGHYRALVGEAPDGKQTEGRLRQLLRLGLVEVCTKQHRAEATTRLRRGVPVTLSETGQGADRHVLSRMGRYVYCLFHGGSPVDLPTRTKLGRLRTVVRDRHDKNIVLRVEDRWPYRHDDITYDVLAACARRGCPIAPGWQARTTLADGKGIDPDGKVLVTSPLGRRWHNIEVELSDTSRSALKRRCEKYVSPHRRDDDPVLFICHHDLAEGNLHLAAAELPQKPPILTTTLRRLKARNVDVLGDGIWLEYGTPVRLAAPGSETQE